jgi:hypothetical protein
MNHQLQGVDARDKGQIPVSMGTALAIEAALGIYPDRPVSPAPILKVKEVWFNIRTLIRNLYNSLQPDFREDILAPTLHAALVEELGIIESAIVKGAQGLVRVIYYMPDYTTLQRKYPKAQLRQPKTDRQIAYQMLENTVCRLLHVDPPSHDFREYSFAITGNHPEAFIVTHLPVDLLARYSFRKLELLESHSGGIKAYPQWHTKLTGGKELSNFPFNAFTLQLFGDNGNQFAPYLPGIRKQVVELALEDRWSSVTTEDKIRLSLRKVSDVYVRTSLLAML